MERWPSRSGRGRRSAPASKRGVAQQCRRGWMPVPWVMPAARLAREESVCAAATGRGWEGAGLPAEGRDGETLQPTGDLVTGTPREVAFDESMVERRPDLVRAQGVGCTAIERGQACDGSDGGFLGLGSKPLQRHIVGHLGASWGHSGAPRYAQGIRRETPPAGASTEPLDGRGEDNQARSIFGQAEKRGTTTTGSWFARLILRTWQSRCRHLAR